MRSHFYAARTLDKQRSPGWKNFLDQTCRHLRTKGKNFVFGAIEARGDGAFDDLRGIAATPMIQSTLPDFCRSSSCFTMELRTRCAGSRISPAARMRR